MRWISITGGSLLTIAIVLFTGVGLSSRYLADIFSQLLAEDQPAKVPDKPVRQKVNEVDKEALTLRASRLIETSRQGD